MTSESEIDWTTSILAGTAAGCVLLIEHLIFYDPEAARDEPELTMWGSNVIGTATIGAAVVACALADGRPEEAVRHAVIVGVCGAVVSLLRLTRRDLRRRQELNEAAGHGAGMIEGARRYDRAYGRTAHPFS